MKLLVDGARELMKMLSRSRLNRVDCKSASTPHNQMFWVGVGRLAMHNRFECCVVPEIGRISKARSSLRLSNRNAKLLSFGALALSARCKFDQSSSPIGLKNKSRDLSESIAALREKPGSTEIDA